MSEPLRVSSCRATVEGSRRGPAASLKGRVVVEGENELGGCKRKQGVRQPSPVPFVCQKGDNFWPPWSRRQRVLLH